MPETETGSALLEVARTFRGRSRHGIPAQHRLDKATIVTGGGTDVAQLAGKQVINPFPLIVAKSIAGYTSAFSRADSA